MKKQNILTEEEQVRRGELLAELLMLRENKNRDYNPRQYLTENGTKTPLGLFRMIDDIINE